MRVDVEALSAELGEAPTRQFLLDAVGLGEAPATAALLDRSLVRAALLWVGVPAPREGKSAGNLLVLRGHFSELGAIGAAPLDWKARDSGLEALELAPATPAGYSRVYRLPGDELLVWSPAERLAAVERALRGEPDAAPLRPPERGAVSVTARAEALVGRYADRYPELAERFRDVRRIEAFAEPTAGMWRADLTLELTTPEQASEASAVIERLKQALGERKCAVGVLARALVVSSFEQRVRVQVVLLGPEVASVKACILGGGCCA